MLLYIKVIEPYYSNKKWDAENQLKLQKASSRTAKEFLPENVSRLNETALRQQIFDKSQVLGMSKKEAPEVSADINEINDAAAARYAAGNKEAVAMIFKYNSPDRARDACQRIAQEMIKNENNFVKKPFLVLGDRIGDCFIQGNTKRGQKVLVQSLYGFLQISSGYENFADELNSVFTSKL